MCVSRYGSLRGEGAAGRQCADGGDKMAVAPRWRRPPPASSLAHPPASPAPLPASLQGLITRKGPVENFADHIAHSSINFYTVSEPPGCSGRLEQNVVPAGPFRGVFGCHFPPVSPTLSNFPWFSAAVRATERMICMKKRPECIEPASGVVRRGGRATPNPSTALPPPPPHHLPTTSPTSPCSLRLFCSCPHSPLVPLVP